MGIYLELFELAAKAGCLEGWLYNKGEVELHYLEDWIANIDRMYQALPGELKDEVRSSYLKLLKSITEHCNRLLPKDHRVMERLARMSALAQGPRTTSSL